MPPITSTTPETPVILLGGSFDPVHLGHIQLGHCVQQHSQASSVWLIPAGLPWQKGGTHANADHRLAMLESALPHGWRVEGCELHRAGPSYTVDTLTELNLQYPGQTWIWVMGSDQLARLPSWHQWQRLPALARIAVVKRDECQIIPADVEHYFENGRMFWVDMPPCPLSSTAIRAGLADPAQRQHILATTLAPGVASYIEQHGLYK